MGRGEDVPGHEDLLDAILGPDGYALVSLNGLASKEQIDEAMFAAVYPWTDNDVARIGAGIGRALLKHARIDLPDPWSGTAPRSSSTPTRIRSPTGRTTSTARKS